GTISVEHEVGHDDAAARILISSAFGMVLTRGPHLLVGHTRESTELVDTERPCSTDHTGREPDPIELAHAGTFSGSAGAGCSTGAVAGASTGSSSMCLRG